MTVIAVGSFSTYNVMFTDAIVIPGDTQCNTSKIQIKNKIDIYPYENDTFLGTLGDESILYSINYAFDWMYAHKHKFVIYNKKHIDILLGCSKYYKIAEDNAYSQNIQLTKSEKISRLIIINRKEISYWSFVYNTQKKIYERNPQDIQKIPLNTIKIFYRGDEQSDKIIVDEEEIIHYLKTKVLILTKKRGKGLSYGFRDKFCSIKIPKDTSKPIIQDLPFDSLSEFILGSFGGEKNIRTMNEDNWKPDLN